MGKLDIDRLIAGWRGPALAALVAMLAALPGLLATPPLDRDESRYAEATAQMLEARDFVNIEFQDEPRHKKPVGIHWLQAASVAAARHGDVRTIPPYRVPSMLGAALAAAACAWGATAFFGARGGVIAGVALGSSVLLSTEGFFATTDGALCGAITLSMAALGRLYGAARGIGQAGFKEKLLFWIGMALAILIKGPIGPMVVGLTLIALAIADRKAGNGWIKRLGWWWGILLVILTFGPWAYAITVATKGAFWGRAIGGDLAPKLAGGQESHGAPPGYYLVLSLVTFFPATLMLAGAAVAGWTRRAEPAVRFALCWLIPSWLVFELAPTKLPQYVLPLYGALAWLVAAALTRPLGKASRWTGVGLIAFGALVVSAVAIAGHVGLGGPADLPFAVLTVLFALGAAVGGSWLLLRGRTAEGVVLACGLGLLAHAALFGGETANIRGLWPSKMVLEDLRRAGLDPKTSGPVAYVGYAEPSAVFLDGKGTRINASPAEAAAAVAQGRVAVVDSHQGKAFLAALAARGVSAEVVAVEQAYNYSKGRKITLTVYRRSAG
jgi:4-amino-4-deoxy-L-arabinose transferase-like glycosyltransferase